MKNIKNACIGLSLILLFSLFTDISSIRAQTESVKIEVIDIRNNKGQLILAIYTSQEGYPNDPGRAMRNLKSTISDGKATFDFSLSPGQYAISVLHDENNNQKMDTNFLGFPKEGVGASNNAAGFMGPPSFQDASFIIDEGGFIQAIKMTYF